MKVFAPLVLTAALALAGCGAVNTATPATAPDPYQRAATVMQDFSQDLLNAQQAEIALQKSGVIDAPTHKALQNAFLYTAQRGVQIDALIASQGSTANIALQLTMLSGSLGDIVSAAMNLPATTGAQLKASITAIQLLVTGVSAALNISTATPIQNSTTELRWTQLQFSASLQASSS